MSVSSFRASANLLLCLIALSLPFLSCNTLERDTEYPLPREKQDFPQMADAITDIQNELKTEKHPHVILRGFHAKSHGCLNGRLIILPYNPGDTRFGIFVREREYDILARFSNGLGFVQEDSSPDVRGLAIKVLGVEGERVPPVPSDPYPEQHTQDFLMTNNPTQLTSTAQEFMDFGKRQHDIGGFYLLKKWNSIKAAWRTRRHVTSLVNEQYWSDAPIRLGSRAIKFTASPCTKDPSPGRTEDENYLTEDLRTYAANNPICFDFKVQFQLNPRKQPIEDALVEWEEDDTPFVTVARIHFVPQKLKETKGCEDLRFTPWHALTEHQPLGNMNRGRQLVYESSQRNRSAIEAEPDEHTIDTER